MVDEYKYEALVEWQCI